MIDPLQNSIRHNLSLHDMFIRETSPDGKISHWTIRPEANRCLTLEQVYKVSSYLKLLKNKLLITSKIMISDGGGKKEC